MLREYRGGCSSGSGRLAGLAVTAHVGVSRRWHPLARVGLYMLWAGLIAVMLWFGKLL